MQQVTQYLDRAHIDYQTTKHPLAYTAQQTAEQSKVDGMHFCKTVMIIADTKLTMIIMPAPCSIDFNTIATAIKAKQVDLAYEHQFRDVFPDCETGAMPPFGNMFEIPVFMHQLLLQQELISFNAGNHLELLQMKSSDFVDLVQPRIISQGVNAAGVGYEHEHSRQGTVQH
jgi:Ala-tRNA(Pro) deacylase